MPVLSEPTFHGFANLPDATVTYVLLAAFLLVFLGIHISRKAQRSTSSRMASSSQEKGSSLNDDNNNNNYNNSGLEAQSAPPMPAAMPRIQRPPQPPPFTPPMLAQTEANMSSFEPYVPAMEMPPRRRSYTKMTPEGIEVSGEIIVSEGWRRHTRVFGGGVCKACEESERRMSA